MYKNSWTLSISGHHPHVSLEAALDRSPTDVVWNGHRVVAEGGELCARVLHLQVSGNGTLSVF